jgi:5-methyltetrahydrofolate--homocysteine methyltransferase
VACGIDLLITNTLTMNRISIEREHTSVEVRPVNLAGAELARKSAHAGQYVLGDLSATGSLLQPFGDLAEEDAFAAFKEQAAVLAEGGVDGFIIETVFDLNEALCAVRACREVSELPVLATMAFNTASKGGRTLMGNSARQCAQALSDAGCTAVGANCGSLDPFQMAEIVALMKEATPLPILAQPNAGLPRVEQWQTVYSMSPADFMEGISQCILAGARLVGGCCGTSPAHIHTIAERLR